MVSLDWTDGRRNIREERSWKGVHERLLLREELKGALLDNGGSEVEVGEVEWSK